MRIFHDFVYFRSITCSYSESWLDDLLIYKRDFNHLNLHSINGLLTKKDGKWSEWLKYNINVKIKGSWIRDFVYLIFRSYTHDLHSESRPDELLIYKRDLSYINVHSIKGNQAKKKGIDANYWNLSYNK